MAEPLFRISGLMVALPDMARKPELRQGLFMRSHGPVCNAEVLRQVLLWAETDRIAV